MTVQPNLLLDKERDRVTETRGPICPRSYSKVDPDLDPDSDPDSHETHSGSSEAVQSCLGHLLNHDETLC